MSGDVRENPSRVEKDERLCNGLKGLENFRFLTNGAGTPKQVENFLITKKGKFN